MPVPPPPTQPAPPLLVGVVGPSGVGKTTLVAAVIPRLTAAGLRVGAVKHSGHAHPLQPSGSDTGRLLAAGASRVAFVTPAGWVTATPAAPSLADVAAAFSGFDLVLVEGWRSAGLPSLRLSRAGGDDPGWAPPARVVAWVTDRAAPPPLAALPLDPEAVAAALLRWCREGRPPGA